MKAVQDLLVIHESLADDLDGHLPPHEQVFGQIDRPHTVFAQPAHNAELGVSCQFRRNNPGGLVVRSWASPMGSALWRVSGDFQAHGVLNLPHLGRGVRSQRAVSCNELADEGVGGDVLDGGEAIGTT